MGSLTASLRRLDFRFNPEEEIIGKHVYDFELVCIGIVEDWTYSSDSEMKMVVKIGDGGEKTPSVLIPFSDIDKVGQHIVLKTKMDNYLKDLTMILNRLRKENAVGQIINEFLNDLNV